MFKTAICCCACAALWVTPATAQLAANANPANPRTEVRHPQYESAFNGYQSFRDEKLASWRDVNDEAARVGGHLGIFGGGAHAGHNTAKPTANSSAPATATSSPAPHAMHGMHGKEQQGMKK